MGGWRDRKTLPIAYSATGLRNPGQMGLRNAGLSRFLHRRTYQSIHGKAVGLDSRTFPKLIMQERAIFHETAAWKTPHDIPEGLSDFDILLSL